MSDIRWQGFTHDEIYARVQQGPGPKASAGAEAAWTTAERTIRAVDEQLTRAVEQIGASWQGAAADGVQGGMRVMSNWALDAAGDALLTRNGVAAQAEQAGFVRAAMPAPRTAEWNRTVNEVVPGVGLLSAMGDLGALEESMANDRARAVELMEQYTSRSADNQRMMSYWTPPPTVVVEAVAPTATTPGAAVGAAAGSIIAAAGIGRSTPGGGGMAGGPGTGAVPTGIGPSTGPRAGQSLPAGASGPSGPSVAEGAASPGVVPGVPSAGPGRLPGPGASTVPGGPARPSGPPGPGAGGLPGASSSTGTPRGDTTVGGLRPVVPGPPARSGGGGIGDLPGAGRGLPGSAAPLPGGLHRAPGVPADGGSATRWPAEPGPRTGISADGTPLIRGGPAEPVPRTSGTPAEGAPGRGAAVEPATSGGSARGSGSTGHGILPMGAVAKPSGQEHRRPDYLVDDTDAFSDDRWFTPPVIGGDVEMPRV